MPIVTVQLIEGRAPERIARLIAELTDAAARALDAPRASVRVLVHELPAAHWGVAGTPRSHHDSEGGDA